MKAATRSKRGERARDSKRAMCTEIGYNVGPRLRESRLLVRSGFGVRGHASRAHIIDYICSHRRRPTQFVRDAFIPAEVRSRVKWETDSNLCTRSRNASIFIVADLCLSTLNCWTRQQSSARHKDGAGRTRTISRIIRGKK